MPRMEIKIIHTVATDAIDKVLFNTSDEMSLPAEQSIWNLSRERGQIFEVGERYEIIINKLPRIRLVK